MIDYFDIIIRALCIIVIGFFFTFIFRRVSGGFSLSKLNIFSLSYYMILVFGFVGSAIIYLGYKENYYTRLINNDIISPSFWMFSYSIIVLPLVMNFCNKLCRIHNYPEFYEDYIKKQIVFNVNSDSNIYIYVVILTIICAFSLLYTFYHIGYIPIIELLKGKLYLLSDRVSNSRAFKGNIYIRNIFALGLTPYLSYLAYIYYREQKEKKWKYLFIVLLMLSIMAKTYDFSKAPIIKYALVFYFVEILRNNVHNIKKIARFIGMGILALLFMYYVLFEYSGKLFTLSGGPVGRIFISQIAGFFLGNQVFPYSHDFLHGSSFPISIATIFGLNEYGIRSGRIVMETFFRSGVASGTADVMNTYYISEAYANFGWMGAIIAPIIVGVIISILPNFVLKQRKTPLNMVLYTNMVFTYVNGLFGGFVDYIYNVQLLANFIILVFLVLLENRFRIPVEF